MKKIIFSIIFLSAISCFAQESEQNKSAQFSVASDLASRYIWRGKALSTTPCVQPSINFTSGNFSVQNWNSYSFGKEGLQEVDLYLSYTLGSFKLSLNDYFMPGEDSTTKREYFNLQKGKTKHVIELYGEFNGPENFPVKLAAGTFVYGDDLDANNSSLYSSYCEVGFTFRKNEVSIYPYIGFTPFKGYYHTETGIVNAGLTVSKSVQVTDKYNVPVSVSFITNPAEGNVFVLLTASIF